MAKAEHVASDSGSWIWKDDGAREDNLIVFVHGYTGDPDATWVKFPHLLRQIGQGFETGFEVASFGYDTHLLTNRQSIEAIAQVLLSFLDAQADAARSVFIIAHSLGGIVTRRMLIASFSEAPDAGLFAKVRQVHFIGVPHEGAARAPKALGWVRRINPQAADLRRDSPPLKALLGEWNDLVRRCEEDGLALPRLFNYVGNRDSLAPLEQALERFAERELVRVVEGDHVAIAKPHSTENAVYRLVRRHILTGAEAPDAPTLDRAARQIALGDATVDQLALVQRALQRGDLELGVAPLDDKAMGTVPDATPALVRDDRQRVVGTLSAEAAADFTQAVFYGRPGSPPPPPALFIGRDADVQAVKARLGVGTDDSADGAGARATVRGWPGVGKTTLAITLAHDRDLRRAFPDGVLWTSLGPHPELLAALANWGRALGNDQFLSLVSVDDAVAQLRALLLDRCLLLIVDDVWHVEHAETFRRAAPPSCQLLFTTRDQGVARAIGPTPDAVYALPELTEDHALALLGALAPKVLEEHPDECHALVRDIECLPLALHVAGGMLAAEQQLGLGIDTLLREIREGRTLLAQKAPADMTDLERQTLPTVAVLLARSTDRLDPTTRVHFASLGAFASKPATFDQAALQAVWALDDVRPVVRELLGRGLLEAVGGGRFQLHALLVAHAASMLDD